MLDRDRPPSRLSDSGERAHDGLATAGRSFERGREVAKIAKIAKIAKSGTRPIDTASQRETRGEIGG